MVRRRVRRTHLDSAHLGKVLSLDRMKTKIFNKFAGLKHLQGTPYAFCTVHYALITRMAVLKVLTSFPGKAFSEGNLHDPGDRVSK